MLWRSLSPKRQPQGFIDPCIPTQADRAPTGPDWVHEIKHDGYRLIVRKKDDRVPSDGQSTTLASIARRRNVGRAHLDRSSRQQGIGLIAHDEQTERPAQHS
jgi:hypothetical protein